MILDVIFTDRGKAVSEDQSRFKVQALPVVRFDRYVLVYPRLQTTALKYDVDIMGGSN
jgi:hypothetical protein